MSGFAAIRWLGCTVAAQVSVGRWCAGLAPHVASSPSVSDVDQTIGEVARRTGVTERTLRYYEEIGLLAPRRDANDHRRYDAEHVDRLYRIRLLREFGTPLSAIDPMTWTCSRSPLATWPNSTGR